MRLRAAPLILSGLAFLVGLLSRVAQAERTASIQGLLYISPPGDLSYDVMFGQGVEVLLLKGEGNLEAELKALKEARLPHIRAQEQTATKAYGEFRRALGTEKEKEKREAWRREGGKLEKLRADYEKEVDALLARYALQRTKTDQDGRFRFQGLPPGRYLLHARFEVLRTGTWYSWLHPVELNEGEEREVHLNKPAAISLYY